MADSPEVMVKHYEMWAAKVKKEEKATTKQERKKVIQWLYSMPGTDYSISNLKRALEDLETRRESPPMWMSNPPDVTSVAGGEETSRQETWAIFLEQYESRKSYLEDLIARRTLKAKKYYEVLDLLKQDNYLAAEAIRKKYYEKVKPDRAIYTMFLFCSRETFYRALGRGIRFYYEALPEVFKKIN